MVNFTIPIAVPSVFEVRIVNISLHIDFTSDCREELYNPAGDSIMLLRSREDGGSRNSKEFTGTHSWSNTVPTILAPEKGTLADLVPAQAGDWIVSIADTDHTDRIEFQKARVEMLYHVCDPGEYYAVLATGPACIPADAGFHVPPVAGVVPTAQVACNWHSGKYQPDTGRALCLVAARGYRTVSSTRAEPCDGGTFQEYEAQTTCQPVTSGYHTPADGIGHIHPIPCHNGTFQPMPMQAECISASPGFFVLNDGFPHTTEAKCNSGGRYQDEKGQSECKTAEAGYHVLDDQNIHVTQTPCYNGQYQNETGQFGCIEAPPGHYVADDSRPHTTASICEAGTLQTEYGRTECDDAGRGYYVDDAGDHTTRVKCLGGQYTATETATRCEDTPAGTFILEDSELHTTIGQTCTTGMWQDRDGQITCKNAKAGYYVDDSDHTTRVKCLGGEYTDVATSTTCFRTVLGTFIPEDGLVHDVVGQQCPTGTFANETGMSECYDSEAGYHVKDADHKKQVVCDNGGFQAGTKTNSCTPCASGHYVPADGQPHKTETAAERGHYVDDSDKTRQQVCDNGQYQGDPGSNACDEAVAGEYVLADGRPHTTATPCELGKWQNETLATSCKNAEAGYYVAISDKTARIQCLGASTPQQRPPHDAKTRPRAPSSRRTASSTGLLARRAPRACGRIVTGSPPHPRRWSSPRCSWPPMSYGHVCQRNGHVGVPRQRGRLPRQRC